MAYLYLMVIFFLNVYRIHFLTFISECFLDFVLQIWCTNIILNNSIVSLIGYAGGNMMKKQVDEEDDLKKPLLDDISEKVQKDRCGVKIENDTFSDDKTEEMYTSAKSENNQAEKKDISACKDGSMTGQDDDLFQKQGQECMVKVTGMVVDDKITAHTKYQTTRETRNIEVDQEKQETEKATTASISVENADRAGIEHRQKEEEETCI